MGAAPSISDVRSRSETAAFNKTDLRVCRYDDGSTDGKPELLTPVPAAGCTQPTKTAPGNDFMAGGIPGQVTVDMVEKWFMGFVSQNPCGLGGGQDERLLAYFPEASALALFLSGATLIPMRQYPQLNQPAWILGARLLLRGLDGTCRFNLRLELDP